MAQKRGPIREVLPGKVLLVDSKIYTSKRRKGGMGKAVNEGARGEV